jgi:DNA-binding CsgD family transcriptional regulator
LKIRRDEFLKIVGTDQNYRFGYVTEVSKDGNTFTVCMEEEGASKIAFDKAVYEKHVGLPAVDWAEVLTPQEKIIANLLSEGHSDDAIAVRLNITRVTLRAHLRALRYKLQLDDKAQLITFCEGLKKLGKINNGKLTAAA